LNITPVPEVMTRVFMLFKGVDVSEVDLWEEARVMAGKATSIWRDIIGVDMEKATNTTLFRVLEWGGMEVK
jgi:hypothetical protein